MLNVVIISLNDFNGKLILSDLIFTTNDFGQLKTDIVLLTLIIDF